MSVCEPALLPYHSRTATMAMLEMQMIEILQTQDSSLFPCLLEISEYSLISFQTEDRPIKGARYIRVGNFDTQLIEFQFGPDTLLLRGFTLLLGEGRKTHFSGVDDSTAGLPVFSLPKNVHFSVGTIPTLDVKSDVYLSYTNTSAEIALGDFNSFNRSLTHERVKFLFLDRMLVGLRILALTAKERGALVEFLEF